VTNDDVAAVPSVEQCGKDASENMVVVAADVPAAQRQLLTRTTFSPTHHSLCHLVDQLQNLVIQL